MQMVDFYLFNWNVGQGAYEYGDWRNNSVQSEPGSTEC